MRNKKYCSLFTVHCSLFFILLFTVYCSLFTVFGCGYHLVGSKPLPFDSVTIRPVQNKTYEPRLEERFHKALSKEFISQGIEVVTANGDINLEIIITTFELAAIAAIDEEVQEQSIIMRVNVRIIDKEQIIEFASMESPIKITFPSTGTVSHSVMQKERATDKACEEIAKEIIGKIILRYAK